MLANVQRIVYRWKPVLSKCCLGDVERKPQMSMICTRNARFQVPPNQIVDDYGLGEDLQGLASEVRRAGISTPLAFAHLPGLSGFLWWRRALDCAPKQVEEYNRL